MNYTLAMIVTWTGFAMWPTHIDLTLVDGLGVSSEVRLVRDGGSDQWQGVLGATTYTILRPVDGSFQIDDGSAVLAVVGDDFWHTAEHLATFGNGPGVIKVGDYSVDWLDLRVVWVPVFIGFITGMLFDFVTVGPFLILRAVAQGALGVARVQR